MDHLRKLCTVGLLITLVSCAARRPKLFAPTTTTTDTYVIQHLQQNQYVIYVRKGDEDAKALAIKSLKLPPYVTTDYDTVVIEILH